MSEPARGIDAELPWEEARDANLANWESRVAIHVEAYGLEAYVDDATHMSQVVKTDLPVLARFLPGGSTVLTGLDLCHLQCHIGTDTVSLARAGARVTGVDFSPSALAAASAFAEELGVEARWVHADVLDAAAAVADDFDVVYTSIGTIGWLDDLDRWAAQVAALLRPGGVFYIRDGHPAMYGLDEEADDLVTRHRYFNDGRAQAWDDDSTYLGDGVVASPRTYEFPHPISEVVNALIGAGLQLLFMDEGDTLPWKFSELMEELPDTDFAFPMPLRERMPMTFTLVAAKPE